MKAFTQIKALLGDITAIASKLKTEREKLVQRLETLQTMPLSREDTLEHLHEIIDGHAARYQESLALQLKGHFLEPSNAFSLPKNVPILAPWSGTGGNNILPGSLFALLAPTIKEGLSKTLNALDWPECGPSLTERRKEVSSIEKRLTSVEAELQELQSLAASSGVTLSI
jgi:hypothetical protein